MKRKRQWAPYILILPSVIYLAIFFAWPMVQALKLAIWDSDGLLALRADASQESPIAARIPQGTAVEILGQQGNLVAEDQLVGLISAEPGQTVRQSRAGLRKAASGFGRRPQLAPQPVERYGASLLPMLIR
jgi:ABC-type sugar transport system permease subunit